MDYVGPSIPAVVGGLGTLAFGLIVVLGLVVYRRRSDPPSRR